MKSLVWFRRDLRVNDNFALHHASENSSGGVIGVFCLTPKQWKAHDDSDQKIKFWLENLRLLSDSLHKLNIPLLIVRCERFSDVADELVSIAQKHQCSGIYFNKEYEFNEEQRDKSVEAACSKESIETHSFHDRVIVPPAEIATKDGRFYSVFTPYRRVWDRQVEHYTKMVSKPKKQKTLDIESTEIPNELDGFDFSHFRSDLWKPGEQEAAKRIQNFESRLKSYDVARDLPAVPGTSLLSPYLAAGVISPRQCLNVARQSSSEGSVIWVSELTWRDFYTHVMVGFPRVSKHLPFKEKTDAIRWRDDQHDIEAWKTGNTGFPIVDAGMRQLNQTGWMHNRLRMVTAMFLTKQLLVDWRVGEQYFMQKLIDGDLAANNGGWQWSASTGTDAVPYFRIFNPFSQSKRFDADGKFITKFCPELKTLKSSVLHDEKKLGKAIQNNEAEYPAFVVDHKSARDRVLAEFKSLSQD